jgi:hypothetical protein
MLCCITTDSVAPTPLSTSRQHMDVTVQIHTTEVLSRKKTRIDSPTYCTGDWVHPSIYFAAMVARK